MLPVAVPQSHHCAMCDISFPTREWFNLHVSKSHPRCSTCGKYFKSKELLKRHQNETNCKGTSNKILSEYSPERIISEQRKSQPKYYFTCLICKETFADKKTLNCHQQAKEPGFEFTCCCCRVLCKDHDEFAKHLNGHQLNMCHVCGVFNQHFLPWHFITDHLEMLDISEHYPCVDDKQKSLPWTCPNCTTDFLTSESLISHLNECKSTDRDTEQPHEQTNPKATFNKDANEKSFPWSCTKCKAVFMTSQALISHIRECQSTDTESNFVNSTGHKSNVKDSTCWVCLECHLTFVSSEPLIKHKREFHTDCFICHETFPDKFKLQKHQSASEPGYSFKCCMCKVNCLSRTEFRQHMLGHRSKKCHMCGESVNDETLLPWHFTLKHLEIVDTSEDLSTSRVEQSFLWPCSNCKSVFSTSHALISHGKKCTLNNTSFPHQCKEIQLPKKSPTMCFNISKPSHSGITNPHSVSITNTQGHFVLKCSMCKITFATRELFLAHQSEFHPKYFGTAQKVKIPRLRQNRVSVTKQSPILPKRESQIECSSCGTLFPSKAKLINHQRSTKSGYLFKCCTCKVNCKTLSEFDSHLGGHIYNKCHICEQTMDNETLLQHHYKAAHSEVTESWQCTFCKITFADAFLLDAHYSKWHTECLVCDKNFEDKVSLKKHQQYKGQGFLFKCCLCNTFCRKRPEYEEHINSHLLTKHNSFITTHNGNDGNIQPFAQCTNRNQQISSVDEACNNQTIVQNDKPTELLTGKNKKEQQQAVVYCENAANQTVSQNGDDTVPLSQNSIKHDDEKETQSISESVVPKLGQEHHYTSEHSEITESWQCTFCNITFERSSLLNFHQKKWHTECLVCNKTFQDKMSLTKHHQWHEQGFFFKCCVCNELYRNKIEFEKHTDRHLCNNGIAFPNESFGNLQSIVQGITTQQSVVQEEVCNYQSIGLCENVTPLPIGQGKNEPQAVFHYEDAAKPTLGQNDITHDDGMDSKSALPQIQLKQENTPSTEESLHIKEDISENPDQFRNGQDNDQDMEIDISPVQDKVKIQEAIHIIPVKLEPIQREGNARIGEILNETMTMECALNIASEQNITSDLGFDIKEELKVEAPDMTAAGNMPEILHIKPMENNAISYKCSLCPETFAVESELSKHFSLEHEMPFQTKDKPLSGSKSSFKCNICAAVFVRRQSLNLHIKNHPEIVDHYDLFKKAFVSKKCHRCRRSFVSKGNLKRHVKLHCTSKSTVLRKRKKGRGK